MKAYPVKHLIVCHSLKKSSSKRCCHLPLILWLFFPQASTFSPPWQCSLLSGFIRNSITFEEGSAREMGHSLNTLSARSWPWGMHLPLSFAHKQFRLSTTEALPLYRSSPGGYWDDDLYASLISSQIFSGLKVLMLNFEPLLISDVSGRLYIFVGLCPYQIPMETDSKKQ